MREQTPSLERADRFIFALGPEDLATELCRANTAIGIAKIHHVQRELGREPDALFLGGPDMTVTRNLPRWGSGFGYGGVVDWTGPGEPLVVLQVKPNVCGMLVARAPEPPSPRELAARLEEVRRQPGELEGVPLEFDLDRSNHFLNLYTVAEATGTEGRLAEGEVVAILHAAAPELRDDHRFGWGLYWDRSAALREAARHYETPWGPLDVLVGEAAERYFAMHEQAAAFAAQRRLKLAGALLGDLEPLANDLHQGLTEPGRMYLGCHPVRDPQALLPFTVAPHAPAYLLRGRPALGPEPFLALGQAQRAAELGVLVRLEQTGLLPHGAGYAIGGAGEVRRAPGPEGWRALLRRGGQENANPREMVTGYRGEEVLTRTLELGLGEVACRLEFLRQVVAPASEGESE